ncbi:uncharacterized protein Z519_09973 [Cladophialophora bantiana CBS 173.52]|uniref:BTB domain-containing protein n=1 Tax=Cladophialophora bantiana (strain ATCC 10958 / CBS 173.52 / CDC B-1940 / NIH 8579) TaxID=1442370 RepID=A0A0D2EGF1_CLAB1|nr:uncharacterized protein Z519_09973 [Cladophialophora bantiana CBS 173.52]KIW89121.1 hypothetical protein Z519_09973 [Cladophialophora bantiana CBS 173.52]
MSSALTLFAPNIQSNLLLAGSGVNFELCIPGYSFKVHRFVLSECSRYFANVCSGHFQEGVMGYLVLNDVEDPLMVLRMIQSIYIKTYTDQEANLPEAWRRYLKQSRVDSVVGEGTGAPAGSRASTAVEDEEDRASSASFTSENKPDDLFLHIDMYWLGEFYAIHALSTISLQKFVQATSGVLFSGNLLLWTIEYLYITSPNQGRATLGQKMRMRAVYLAQKSEMRLFREKRFKLLMETTAEFMWDYTTKCLRAKYLQCRREECEATIEPKAGDECDCGGEDVCQVCFDTDWHGRLREMPMCPKCNQGRLARWDLDFVDKADRTGVNAFGEMFHPAASET